MGEMAEMMLDGTLCGGCGCFLDESGGEGFQRFCHSCRRDGIGISQKKNLAQQPIGDKQRKLLEAARLNTDEISGMYPGIYIEQAPSQIRKLINRGLLEEYRPHNPVHKMRAVITDAGRAVLLSK